MRLSYRKAMMLVVSLFLVFPSVSFAQPKLAIEMAAQKEVAETVQGKEVKKLIAVDKAEPGDTVVYTIAYSNAGTEDLINGEIVDPIPGGVTYIDKSAGGKDTTVLFSIDGGKTYSEPPVYYMDKNPEGKEVKREATGEMYTHIKWKILVPLKPGQKGIAAFKAKVK